MYHATYHQSYLAGCSQNRPARRDPHYPAALDTGSGADEYAFFKDDLPHERERE